MSCAVPSNRKEAFASQPGSECAGRYGDAGLSFAHPVEFPGAPRQQINITDLPFLYQGQPRNVNLQPLNLSFLPGVPSAGRYQAPQQSLSLHTGSCNPHSFQGSASSDQPYCYSNPGLEEAHFQLGRLCPGNEVPETYRAPCGSQSVDSDGTIAGHLSRPGSSEVRQDFKVTPANWNLHMDMLPSDEELLLQTFGSTEEDPLMQPTFQPNQPAEVPNYAVGQPIFQDPFLDIPTMLCDPSKDLPEKLPPLDFSLQDSEEPDLQPDSMLKVSDDEPPGAERSEAVKKKPVDGVCRVALKRRRSSQSGDRPTYGMLEAQRARTRETARKLRQRKVEALQRLQGEVMELAKENHFLAEKLQTSVSKLDQLNTQNDCLRDVLRCLQPDPDKKGPSSPRFKKLLEIKQLLEAGEVPGKAAGVDGSVALTVQPLASQKVKVGKSEEAVKYAVPIGQGIGS